MFSKLSMNIPPCRCGLPALDSHQNVKCSLPIAWNCLCAWFSVYRDELTVVAWREEGREGGRGRGWEEESGDNSRWVSITMRTIYSRFYGTCVDKKHIQKNGFWKQRAEERLISVAIAKCSRNGSPSTQEESRRSQSTSLIRRGK